MTETVRLEDIFDIRTGDYHAVKELEPGRIPLVSCGDVNHGLVGFYDVPEGFCYCNAITVAYNGQPLTAKYRPYTFGAKDDIGVLLPRKEIGHKSLVYITALLNYKKWQYSYGRKCFQDKMKKISIDLPVSLEEGELRIDEAHINTLLEGVVFNRRPPAIVPEETSDIDCEWGTLKITDLFELKRGSFHSLNVLDSGTVATVSRTERDNGVVGYYEPPENCTTYPPGLITVSTVTGDAFVQVVDFICTDNVIVCVPLKPYKPTTFYFVASIINQQKWRYGYGRQCYKKKLSRMILDLPCSNGELDEETISRIVGQRPYWSFIYGAIHYGET